MASGPVLDSAGFAVALVLELDPVEVVEPALRFADAAATVSAYMPAQVMALESALPVLV